jgi:hypothetical protein
MSLPSGREHVANVGQAVVAWAAWFFSLNWNALNAFLACVATFLVVLNMLGLLAPLKAAAARLWRKWVPAK